jgi:catechol 2,3-dioxygenase-like lactoylglutathione lyase family enzyme
MFSPDALIAMYVPNVREALDFYTDKLGFKVITDRADEEFSFATAALPGANWRFGFLRPDVHGEEMAARFKSEVGFAPHFMLTTDNLNAEIKRLEAKGVEITEYPTLQASGLIQAHIKDLYGNVITLMATESLF